MTFNLSAYESRKAHFINSGFKFLTTEDNALIQQYVNHFSQDRLLQMFEIRFRKKRFFSSPWGKNSWVNVETWYIRERANKEIPSTKHQCSLS